MKKISKILIAILALASFTACGAKKQEAKAGKASEQTKTEAASEDKFKDKDVIKLGLIGENNEDWDDVAKRFEKATGKKLEIVKFSEYREPNEALIAGDIDINAFQHKKFLEDFNQASGSDIVSIGDTAIAPLGIYSSKIKDIKDLKDGAKVTIPDDPSNGARALFLLQSAGLIKVSGKEGDAITPADIKENPKKLEIIELSAAQTARSLDDSDIAVINSGMAVDAGFIPTRDAIFLEDYKDPAKAIYVNIVACLKENANSATLKDLVENYYQTAETAKIIEETTKGSSVPVFDY